MEDKDEEEAEQGGGGGGRRGKKEKAEVEDKDEEEREGLSSSWTLTQCKQYEPLTVTKDRSHLLTWRRLVYDLYCSQPPGGVQKILERNVVHLYLQSVV